MGYDFMQYAKDRAKADKELNIEQWVSISIERTIPNDYREKLYKYDIQRHMLDKWRWVIHWRQSKLQCQYPRSCIQVYHHFYDKRTRLEMGFGSLLSKLSSAKTQIIKVERTIDKYIELQTQNNMFFDVETDEMLLKAKKKLEQKKLNYNAMYATLEQEVEQHQSSA